MPLLRKLPAYLIAHSSLDYYCCEQYSFFVINYTVFVLLSIHDSSEDQFFSEFIDK